MIIERQTEIVSQMKHSRLGAGTCSGGIGALGLGAAGMGSVQARPDQANSGSAAESVPTSAQFYSFTQSASRRRS